MRLPRVVTLLGQQRVAVNPIADLVARIEGDPEALAVAESRLARFRSAVLRVWHGGLSRTSTMRRINTLKRELIADLTAIADGRKGVAA